MNATVSGPRQLRISLSFNGRRDWPLAGAAITALLSFIMLFPPWISGDISLNAFGENMPSAGPALIIVMALGVLAFTILGLTTDEAKCHALALFPASNLLVIYIVKLADTSDQIDQTTQGFDVSIGVGLWLGFLFSLATFILLILAQALRRGFLEVRVTREHGDLNRDKGVDSK